MDDKTSKEFKEILKSAYNAREYGEPSEDFTQTTMKKIRLVSARRGEQRLSDSPRLFEILAFRFASGAVAFAAVIVTYSFGHGLGFSSVLDVVPQETLQLMLGAGMTL